MSMCVYIYILWLMIGDEDTCVNSQSERRMICRGLRNLDLVSMAGTWKRGKWLVQFSDLGLLMVGP